MKDKIEYLEKGILESLPQIPYIIDQVFDAVKWVKEEKPEGELHKILKATYEVTKYAAKISETNFFKTHLVLASLLQYLPNVLEAERFSRFDNPSKTVEEAIKSLKVDENLVKERGCFNAISLHAVSLAHTDEDLLCVFLIHALNDLKEIVAGMKETEERAPITPQDYITVLGYALVLANMSLSNLSLLNETQDILNEMRILLNNEVIF